MLFIDLELQHENKIASDDGASEIPLGEGSSAGHCQQIAFFHHHASHKRIAGAGVPSPCIEITPVYQAPLPFATRNPAAAAADCMTGFTCTLMWPAASWQHPHRPQRPVAARRVPAAMVGVP
mmetsp:Transcript_47014/g.125053  ORF Transcript_47014/g.125053 Transcript_47014/m.125053 type:complete len:122 (-) Transcript_47014:149-514(-)